jgi:hypothetical protein
MRSRNLTSLRGAKRRSNPLSPLLWLWIASRSLSSGAHSRDPLARNNGFTMMAQRRLPHSQPSSPAKKRAIQYSETSVMEPKSRGVLDTPLSRGMTPATHNSRALLNANEDTRRVFSSRIRVRVIGGSARWLQFSRSQSRQLTPIGVPSVFSRSIPVA